MAEFDLLAEKENTEQAAMVLEQGVQALGFDRNRFAVPQVLEVSEDRSVLLMQFVEGSNLSTQFPQDGEWQPQESSQLVKDLIGMYLHGLIVGKLVHADLHPANIISHRERVTLLDWGMVMRLPEEASRLVFTVCSELDALTDSD